MPRPILYCCHLATLFCLILTFLPTHFASAEDSTITITAHYRQDSPITLDMANSSEISSLDPALASDGVSITPIENLFLGLTDLDPVTGEIVPELATAWSISEDGLTWTFALRNDVMWMHYDPATDTATPVRPVVASDFVYGIQRACDPRLGGYYGTVVAKVIAGCDIVNRTPNQEVTDELVASGTIRAVALNDTTLSITLLESAGYFLSMTSMWMLRPVPRETIETFGDEWTLPGKIVTNGPYFVDEITRGIRRVFVRNTALPTDLARTGNIDLINTLIIEDSDTMYVLYRHNEMDATPIPVAEIQNALADPVLSQEVKQIGEPAVFYFAFAHDKPPFDNVHVRRAFSAIIDRQAFIAQIRAGRGVPMIHFTPPGMFGAPPIDEVGVGFNPDYAREQMVLAGYPNCEGLPPVVIVAYQGAGTWVEYFIAAAEEHLGCVPTLFDFVQLEFVIIDVEFEVTPPSPQMQTLGWGPDYPDAQNWLGDVLHCNARQEPSATDENLYRPCTTTDDLIDQAARENDPAIRAALYRQIEENFFGPDGEFPIAPIFMRASYILVKSWYSGPFETDMRFGNVHWDAYSIDLPTKLAARPE